MTRNALLIDELKVRRQTLGWSLKEVGERCAIDEVFLREWEGGAGSPRLDAVDAWTTALGLKLLLAPAECGVRGGIGVDWQRRRIAIDGTPVRLTPMEWKALERLAATPGEVVSHQALFHHLYGDERPYSAQSTAIRVLITKLRRLLPPLRIEAQWGRGYLVSGIAPSAPSSRGAFDDSNSALSAAVAAAATAATATATAAAPPHLRAAAANLPYPTPSGRGASLHQFGERSEPASHRPALAAIRIAPQRTEELSVIERFLAERGVTHCPDVATIERSPLPTLVWDKVKRKWVRPGMSGRQAAG
jgi:DNA-binding winged helix-turn-helix (wHTH) protein